MPPVSTSSRALGARFNSSRLPRVVQGKLATRRITSWVFEPFTLDWGQEYLSVAAGRLHNRLRLKKPERPHLTKKSLTLLTEILPVVTWFNVSTKGEGWGNALPEEFPQ